MAAPRTTRTFAALLWLLMLLMPVRGMALGWMLVTVPAQPMSVSQQAQPMPPCHTAMADANEATPDADTSSNRSACAACDLCHSGVVPTTVVSFSATQLHDEPPQEGLSAPHERPAPDSLFRPPR